MSDSKKVSGIGSSWSKYEIVNEWNNALVRVFRDMFEAMFKMARSAGISIPDLRRLCDEIIARLT